MAVFRVERNTGYTVMSNHHLRNKELSLKAKGLLSQMLSLPEDWDYTLAGLSYINRESIDASQTKDSDNHVVQDYSEEYEVSPYGSEEELDTLDDLKISMSTEKDLDLKHLSFLIENTSDKEYRYSPNYFEIEAEQSGTWYQLEQLDDPSKSNEKDCFIKPNERLTLEIDVKSFYGELPAGHYRLIKQFAFFESERDWDYDTYNLSCEFTIR